MCRGHKVARLAGEGRPVLARGCAERLAKAVAEMAGAGKPAQQRNLSQRKLAQAQQLASPVHPSCQQVLVWRQTKAAAEHAREVIFGEVAAHGQLTEGNGLVEVRFDVFDQLSTQGRRQPPLRRKPWRRPTWLSTA